MYLPDSLPAIERVMRGDLSFKGSSPDHVTHNTHAFAAKFPPQLPEVFIKELTKPGELVLDPMAGSGTALVEAARLGRVGIGSDIDPLAARICKAKTAALDVAEVGWLAEAMVDHAQVALATYGADYGNTVLAAYDPTTADFLRYWFLPQTIAELGALAAGIRALVPAFYRPFFEVLFSSMIVTKSGGVSLARDLAHSRPHKVTDKKIKSAVAAFQDKAAKSMSMLREVQGFPGSTHVLRADSRHIPLQNDSVDMIVTSPPYANAIDYVRAHKFSLVWLGHNVGDLAGLRKRFIGAEVRPDSEHDIASQTGQATVGEISGLDARRAQVVRHYFLEMTTSLKEMKRVLRTDRSAIVVVGSSTVRGVLVNTALILAEIGKSLGFKLVALKERDIDRDRRLMPISRSSDQQGIEARMHSEHVIAFIKPG